MIESGFKQKIHKALRKRRIYSQSMSSYATNGTPDIWVSAVKDLWIEVKFDQKTKGAIKPKLTPLQANWINDRYKEGRQVIVIVGTSSKDGIVYVDGEWGTHKNARVSFDELIEEIIKLVVNDEESNNLSRF